MKLFVFLRRLACCNSGTATLEMAIVLPVAILLMVGGVEFGSLFSSYGTASKSVRDATRYLTRVPTTDLSGNPTGAICAPNGWGYKNAKNLAIYGNTSGTGTPLIPTTTTLKLNIADCNNPTDINLELDTSYTPLVFTTIVGYSNGNLAPGFASQRTITVSHQETWIGE